MLWIGHLSLESRARDLWGTLQGLQSGTFTGWTIPGSACQSPIHSFILGGPGLASGGFQNNPLLRGCPPHLELESLSK